MITSQNLFPLPYWAPSFWRVPIPLHLLNEAYARGPGRQPKEKHLARNHPAINSTADEQSREDFDRFVQDRLRPAFDSLGISPQPKISEFKVYNTMLPGKLSESGGAEPALDAEV